MQVASDGQGEAGETDVNTDDELVGGVKACHFDDDVQVLGPVGGVRIAEGRTGRPVAFAYLGDGLVAVQTNVAIVPGLTGGREIDGADAGVEHHLVANPGLAVVLGIEVIDQEDGLVGVRGSGVYRDRREEHDPVATLEVYCFELFLDVDVAGPIVVAQILPLGGSNLVPLGRPAMIVSGVLGRDEVETEVALGSRNQLRSQALSGNGPDQHTKPEEGGSGQYRKNASCQNSPKCVPLAQNYHRTAPLS